MIDIGAKYKNGEPIKEGDKIKFGEDDEYIGFGVVYYDRKRCAFMHTFQEYFWDDDLEMWYKDMHGYRPSKALWTNPNVWFEKYD
jgi:hypothetical protein